MNHSLKISIATLTITSVAVACGAKTLYNTDTAAAGSVELTAADSQSKLVDLGSDVGDVAQELTADCNGNLYDPNQEICCNGVISRRTSGTNDEACCGKFSYSPRSFLCCNGAVATKQFGDACCGQHTYDPDSTLCCDGMMISKWPENRACCGQHTYDTNHELCCDGFTLIRGDNNACCGPVPYDANSKLCCGNMVWEKGVSTRCCGNVPC